MVEGTFDLDLDLGLGFDFDFDLHRGVAVGVDVGNRAIDLGNESEKTSCCCPNHIREYCFKVNPVQGNASCDVNSTPPHKVSLKGMSAAAEGRYEQRNAGKEGGWLG